MNTKINDDNNNFQAANNTIIDEVYKDFVSNEIKIPVIDTICNSNIEAEKAANPVELQEEQPKPVEQQEEVKKPESVREEVNIIEQDEVKKWIQERAQLYDVSISEIHEIIKTAEEIYKDVSRSERNDVILSYVNGELIAGSGQKYLGTKIPKPFKIEDNILYVEKEVGKEDDKKIVKYMVSRGFVIKSIGEIKDKGELESVRYVELAWMDFDHNEKTGLFQTNWILEPSMQKEHMKQFDIAGNKRADIIDYYAKIVQTYEIPKKEITNVGGWKDNFTKYVTADDTYGSDEKYMLIENKSMNNIHKEGTFDNWIEGTYELLNDPVFAFIGYSGVCALIQSPLGIPNHTILDSNLSSTGKTTGARVRGSMFGNSFYMTLTPNASKLGNSNAISAYNDVPCHLDEITKKDVEMITNFIYDHSSGIPRNVANKTGGNKDNKDKIFTNNIFVTTEETLFGADAKTGQLARTIPVLRKPKTNYEGIKKFEKLVCSKNKICKNYGHALEPLVLKIIEMNQNGNLRKRYNEIIEELRNYNEKKSPVIDRLVEYYAGIALAGEIFNEAIVNHPENRGRIQALNPIEIVKDFMQDYMDQEPEKPESERAMETFMSWYNGNKFKFNEPEPIAYSVNGETEYRGQKTNFYGYNTDKEIIYVFNGVVDNVLTKAGFNYNTILKAWGNDGYIIQKRKGKNVYQKTLSPDHQKIVGKEKLTCVSILKSKVQHLIVDDKNSSSYDSANTIISDFCKDKLIIGNTIIDATLKEVYQSYTEWCKDNSVIPMNIALFFGAFISSNKNVAYDQTDANDMNSIIFQCVGLKELNICTPKKLHLTDDEVVPA